MLEKKDWNLFKSTPVAGVDEVGRGCLAGPVMAAAVVIPDQFKFGDPLFSDFTDSKLISEKKREKLAGFIRENFLWGLGQASVEEIDQINILQASFLAMRRALAQLESKFSKINYIIVDGNQKIPQILIPQSPIVKGDLIYAPISAAAILAKVTRDNLMKELDLQYPSYGFCSHKGYASALHRQQIQEKGPCILHRRSFSPIKELIQTK